MKLTVWLIIMWVNNGVTITEKYELDNMQSCLSYLNQLHISNAESFQCIRTGRRL